MRFAFSAMVKGEIYTSNMAATKISFYQSFENMHLKTMINEIARCLCSKATIESTRAYSSTRTTDAPVVIRAEFKCGQDFGTKNRNPFLLLYMWKLVWRRLSIRFISTVCHGLINHGCEAKFLTHIIYTFESSCFDSFEAMLQMGLYLVV